MRTLENRPVLRWIAPVAALAVAGGAVLATNTASADVKLPNITKQELVAKVAQADVQNLSGTISETANLGLPSLPVSNGSGDSTDFSSLISGNHTLKLWSSGAEKSRVMLTGSFGESDLVRNGSDVWSWNSKAKTASHLSLPSRTAQMPKRPAGEMPTTPQDAAKQALNAVGKTTTVTKAANQIVAGRKTYVLVLTPKSSDTLVGSVRIAVDGSTYLPLGVYVYAKANPSKAALAIDYSEIHYTKPADSVFAFRPPAGTKVTEHKAPTGGRPGSLHGPKPGANQQAAAQRARKAAAADTKTYGTGWSSVVVAKVPSSATSSTTGRGSAAGQWQQTLNQLPTVQGKGWTGHALNGTLFSVVVTSDNRVAIGAVGVDRLVRDLG